MDLNKRFPRYSRWLKLYPAGYRQEYGEQMLQTLADMLDNAEPEKRRLIWLRTAIDLPISAGKQQLMYEGAVMHQNMPDYIKRNGVLGAWLLTPFFFFVILNAIVGKALQNTVFWHSNVLFAWIVLLPTIALGLNLAAWLRWTLRNRQEKHVGVWRSALDLYHNWPVVLIAFLGAGILGLVFFHDSVHCVTGNPISELQHRQQTLRCLEQR